MMTWLHTSRERDSVRFAYRHSTPEVDIALTTTAQAWPKRMSDILERCVKELQNAKLEWPMHLWCEAVVIELWAPAIAR